MGECNISLPGEIFKLMLDDFYFWVFLGYFNGFIRAERIHNNNFIAEVKTGKNFTNFLFFVVGNYKPANFFYKGFRHYFSNSAIVFLMMPIQSISSSSVITKGGANLMIFP